MKIYVAGGFGHWRAIREIQILLRGAGHIITYDWTQAAKQVEYGNPEPRSTWPMVAVDELAGVEEADLVVVRLPGASGTHAELGAALIRGKPVVLAYAGVLPDCIAYHHPFVRHVESLNPADIVREVATGREVPPDTGGPADDDPDDDTPGAWRATQLLDLVREAREVISYDHADCLPDDKECPGCAWLLKYAKHAPVTVGPS